MDWKDVVVGVLLGLAVAVQLGAALGLLLMPHLYDRLHFLGPAGTVAPVLVAAAVVTREALDHQGIFAVLVAAFMLAFQPVLTHATARAARIRRHGDWRVQPGEAARRP
ncbi:MAG TPA: monovalent cation/H(+) antiporter subunit G [Actinomycetota bacterium]